MKTINYNEFTNEAVVVDAGTIPTNKKALQWLDKCERIVCCDGAAKELLSRGYLPWRIVGDCDSLDKALLLRYKDIVRKNPDQETNDQTKSVEYLLSKGVRKIVIIGATGKREDHTLGNISLLIEYLKRGVEARIYTDYGVFIPVSGDCKIVCEEGTQVSIFNFGARGMRGEGLRYPIRDFDNWWQGTLNETIGESFTIRADGCYLVYVNYAG